MTNQQAYEGLTKAHANWDRVSENEIVVWTSGYLTDDCRKVETYLMQAGMRATSQEFDSISGKTRTVYRHKQNS